MDGVGSNDEKNSEILPVKDFLVASLTPATVSIAGAGTLSFSSSSFIKVSSFNTFKSSTLVLFMLLSCSGCCPVHVDRCSIYKSQKNRGHLPVGVSQEK